MKKRQTLALVAAVVVIAMVALVFGKIYSVQDDGGGTLLWNGNEAYLFMGVSRRGFQIGYLEYPWVLLKALLYGVREPDDQRTSVTVIHVTTAGVEHHVVEMLDEEQANTPDLHKPFQGGIYANCHGSLCRLGTNSRRRQKKNSADWTGPIIFLQRILTRGPEDGPSVALARQSATTSLPSMWAGSSPCWLQIK